MRKFKIFTIICFLFILLFFPVMSGVMPGREFSDMENRKLAQKPLFSVKSFLDGKYQDSYGKWLNDQFPGRDGWSLIAANLQALYGKKDINGVYIGKDGYLLEKYNEKEFDTEQIKENIKYLSDFLDYSVKNYGKDNVYCIMLPSKTEILDKKMPAFAETTGIEETLKTIKTLKNRLEEPDILTDARDILKDHKEEYIYYHTDHHWTTLGAYYIWAEFARKAGFAVKEPGYYKREIVFDKFYGTTYNKAHINVNPDNVELFHSPGEERVQINMDNGKKLAASMYFPEEAKKGFNKYEIFFSGNTFKIEISTSADTGKTLLLIKDSFANCFVPFLTEDYSKIIMIDYRYGKTPVKDIITQYKNITDIMVMFNTEKFMQNTKLKSLASTGNNGTSMKKFNLEDFLE